VHKLRIIAELFTGMFLNMASIHMWGAAALIYVEAICLIILKDNLTNSRELLKGGLKWTPLNSSCLGAWNLNLHWLLCAPLWWVNLHMTSFYYTVDWENFGVKNAVKQNFKEF